MQRHQKINRISVKNEHLTSHESHQLQRISENAYNQGLSGQIYRKSGSVSSNIRKPKPFSANQHTSNARVIHEPRDQGASTHYSSFKPLSMPTANNFTTKQESNELMSNDGGQTPKSFGKPATHTAYGFHASSLMKPSAENSATNFQNPIFGKSSN